MHSKLLHTNLTGAYSSKLIIGRLELIVSAAQSIIEVTCNAKILTFSMMKNDYVPF